MLAKIDWIDHIQTAVTISYCLKDEGNNKGNRRKPHDIYPIDKQHDWFIIY